MNNTRPPNGHQYGYCKNCNQMITWVPYDSGYWMHHNPQRGQFWDCTATLGGSTAEFGRPYTADTAGVPDLENNWQTRLI